MTPVTAPATTATAAKPNILLITIDTLRPDAVGWTGGNNDTPTMDTLAAQGFRFPKTITTTPLTLPAHTSLFSGLLPFNHGVRDNGRTVAPSVDTLAKRLAKHGYVTGAFVSGFPLQSMFGLDAGFEHYDDDLDSGVEGWVERKAADTAARAAEWAASQQSPWFAWVHFYDPHDPYEPPRAFWQPGQRGPYDGEVAYVDYAIGQLLARLDDDAPRLTVITADHGEALGEHEEDTHGYFVYDSTMVVPTLFHWPSSVAPGESLLQLQLVDIAPTVLDLAQLPPLDPTDGRSVSDTIRGRPIEARPAMGETRLPWIYFGWSPLQFVRHEGFKLIVAPTPELYDLTKDPHETNNVIQQYRPLARQLRGMLEKALASATPAASTGTTDPETLAKLRSLGYVGSGKETGPSRDLADPKDRINTRRALLQGESMLRGGQVSQAVAVFDAVLQEHPTNRFATLRKGVALLKAGALEEAAVVLAKAVELDPNRAEARFAYADVLTRLERPAEASEHWFELVRMQPRRAEGWSYLAASLLDSDRAAEAGNALQSAIALQPAAGHLYLQLARAELAQSKPKDASKALERALEIAPALSAAVSADPALRALQEAQPD